MGFANCIQCFVIAALALTNATGADYNTNKTSANATGAQYNTNKISAHKSTANTTSAHHSANKTRVKLLLRRFRALKLAKIPSEGQQWFCLEHVIVSNKLQQLHFSSIAHNSTFMQAQRSNFPLLRPKGAHCQLHPTDFSVSRLVQLSADPTTSFDSEKTELVYACLKCLRNAIPQLSGPKLERAVNAQVALSCPAKCAYTLANYYMGPVLGSMCRTHSRRLKGCGDDDDDGDDDDSVGCANLEKQEQASAERAVAASESSAVAAKTQHRSVQSKDFASICPPSESSNQYSCTYSIAYTLN
jgi:hypothetical protein